VVYFALVAVTAAARAILHRVPAGTDGGERRRAGPELVAVVPLLVVVVAHAAVLPGRLADARDFNRDGRIQDGPAHPKVVAVAAAVEDLTPPDAVITYYRARTMTLLTDRRAIQTRDIGRILARSDYWVQRRDWSFWQPDLDEDAAAGLGLTAVWSSDRYVVWKTP
jgi:hypothetical protein